MCPYDMVTGVDYFLDKKDTEEHPMGINGTLVCLGKREADRAE